MPLNLQLDSYGSKSQKRDVATKIRDLMLDFNLVDIWRLRNPDKKRYTWKQNKPLIQRRLDYWLISDDFQDDVQNTGIISAIKTDHAAIVLQISSVEKQPTGPSYWKFNSSLLEVPEYINLIKDNVPSWLAEFGDVSDKGLLWDLIKYKIRQVTMRFSKTKARERRSRLWEIENKLKDCQEIFDAFPTEKNAIQLETIKSEYNSLYDYIIQGNVIRSRANWYEYGEKNNKYFLNLESRRMSNSCIRKLFDKGGKLISSPKLILSELHDFYTELYSNCDPSNHNSTSDAFLDHCRLPTLNEDAKQICEGVLTKDVLNEIIWNNQNLLINKQSIYSKKIKEAGFLKIGDILSNSLKLKSWDAFRAKSLSLSDYLLLQGIFSAIPHNWKLPFKDGENTNNRTDETVSDDDVQDITRMTSKSIYSTLVKRIQISPTAQSKFNSLYNIFGITDWKNIYQLPGQVTVDTRTRVFQYKIINRILYTNKTLYKMDLVPSPMCTFCGDHEETLEHLLVSCAYTKIFWLSVISWLITYNMKIDKLDEVTILFGIFDNNIENCLLNHLIILGKYTIYLCRCKNIKPSLPLLKAKITETRKLEFSIAKKNKKESIHYKKWQKMLL